MKKKTVAILMATAMICSGVAGATVAWLTASTSQIVNTFTYGNIDIDLTEDNPGVDARKDIKMIPGTEITKDPKVTVKKGSEACWLFVKVEESTSVETFLSYGIADGWMELGADDPGVYYREVPSQVNAMADVFYGILSDNKVTVNDTVTKAHMDELESGTTAAPTLTFTAYAVQQDNIKTAVEAWGKVPPPTPETP